MTKLHALADLGQAIWLDYIRRSFITQGELQKLIDQGVRGVTSNPTIFEKAIAGSADYDEDLRKLVATNASINDLYEFLALDDIGRAADQLRPLYDATKGGDGYVSIEVSPTLAHDTDGTIAEGKRLFATLKRPNIMIKVPATPAGVPAIKALIGAGINVNVTLIFSISQYEAVMEAYLAGLEHLGQDRNDLSGVASVASFFVSRVDTAVDKALEKAGASDDLRSKAAIANAKVAYARFHEIFAGSRWESLASRGAQVQRPLWASTGTKDPSLPDTLYVDGLIGAQTVNTVPPATLQAFQLRGTVADTLEAGTEDARAHLAKLTDLGIDLGAITQQLQDDGVASFAKSFESLMASIEEKRERLLAEQQDYSASLGDYQARVDAALADLRDNNIVQRIWEHDHTVWKPEPTEITNRLGWLHSPEVMAEHVSSINELVETVRSEGFTQALLLGMGGSSLAPEMFRLAFGVKPGYLDLAVLDSTDPGAVLANEHQLDISKTLFIVSTKSGGTVETFSFFKHFYNRAVDTVGTEKAGQHFVAITDPGSGLADTAKKYRFRKTFLNDPNIGGRYSALSFFGLLPAALVGVDVAKILDRAATIACNCEGPNCPVGGDNSGAWLGAIIGELAVAGRDKVTLITSPPIDAFGAWVEQLIAESTGKENMGILPVDGEPVGAPSVYGDDRLFVYLRVADDTTHDSALAALNAAGHPVVQFNLRDLYDLGGEFFRWEMATVIAGRRININPFDQPNVEDAKILARKMVAAYQEEGVLPSLKPTLTENDITVYADFSADSLQDAINMFFGQVKPGDYISLQAYIPPTQETTDALQALRTRLRDQLKVATTVGYGPRFLHSTGQLHKGDGGNGLFIQFTADAPQDVPIPDEAGASASSITFGVLVAAQALGDRQALLDNKRRFIRFHLGSDVLKGLKQL